jgi:hypothetical protein
MTFEGFDWQGVLDNWDVKAEQRKADFMEFLYDMYEPENGLYTGLWQRFKDDIACGMRDKFFEDKLTIETSDS